MPNPRSFGRDREDSPSPSTSDAHYASPGTYPSRRHLHHADSSESLDCRLARKDAGSQDPEVGPKGSTAGSSASAQLGPPIDIQRSPRSSFGSESIPSAAKRTDSFEIAYTVDIPRDPCAAVCEATEEEKGSGHGTRAKIRAFYEENGWLPAPVPARRTRLHRKRAM